MYGKAFRKELAQKTEHRWFEHGAPQARTSMFLDCPPGVTPPPLAEGRVGVVWREGRMKPSRIKTYKKPNFRLVLLI